jgi:hypothetical protein
MRMYEQYIIQLLYTIKNAPNMGDLARSTNKARL